jgi:hypothetical protein
MRVGEGGVPVHRRHVVETVLEVTRHLPHEGLDEAHEVELVVVEHADHEAELMGILLRGLGKCLGVEQEALGIEQGRIRAMGPFALGEVPEVSAGGAW